MTVESRARDMVIENLPSPKQETRSFAVIHPVCFIFPETHKATTTPQTRHPEREDSAAGEISNTG